MLSHHLLDCLAVVPPLAAHLQSLPANTAARLVDVGSGAGLPAVVLAVMLPGLGVTSIDAVGKKAAFVRQAAGEMGLKNLTAEHGRVEQLQGSYHIVASRAFASLVDFVSVTRHLLASGGLWMAMKGPAAEQEAQALPADVQVFHVEHLRVPSVDGERRLVWLRTR
jgi:16S rRNA (guanine527-N7)-methyltransferase